jgi:hypothetical protein
MPSTYSLAPRAKGRAPFELLAQDAPQRHVQPLLADAARGHEVEEDVVALLPAELVAAGVQDLRHTLVRREVLGTPGARGMHGAEQLLIGDQAPVGADDALEPEAPAQQVRDDALVEAEADLLVLGAHRLAVVRHDLAGPRLEGLQERAQVVVERAAGVHLLGAVREVRILPVLLRAAAGEVLRHGGDRSRAERLALESADVGRAQLAGEVGVLAERL